VEEGILARLGGGQNIIFRGMVAILA